MAKISEDMCFHAEIDLNKKMVIIQDMVRSIFFNENILVLANLL